MYMRRDDQYRSNALGAFIGFIGIALCCLYLAIMAQL